MKHAKKSLLALLLTPILGLAASPEVSLERMKKDIFFLAGEECKGRGVGSAGIDNAAEHVAKTFQEAGLEPGMGTSYFQPFTIKGRPVLDTLNKALLTVKDGSPKELEFGKEFAILGTSASGKLSSELVFVGYGITVDSPKLKYDDYADLDVKDKVVIMLRRNPKADAKDSPFTEGLAELASLSSKLEFAAKKGVAGVIFVNDAASQKTQPGLMELRRSGGEEAVFPVLQISRELLTKVLESQEKKLTDIEQGIDKDLKPASFAMKGCKLDAEVNIKRTPVACKNVVGILPGSGILADETVVVGAHYDHLGTENEGSLGGAAAKGQVHFGADDNASGTTGLLELARRLGAVKNRNGRRIVLIAFSAEEKGLFGSKHYASQPIIPLEKTVFMLNMDMIGRSAEVDEGGTKKFRLVASGTGTSDTFDKLVDSINSHLGFKMLKTPTGSGPSDHNSFYVKGIPVLYVHTGTHKDYHKPSDTPDKINLKAMTKIVDFVEAIANHMSTTPMKPNFIKTPGRWSDPTDTSPRNMARMPRLGVMPGNYEQDDKGVLVEDVIPGGAAELGGIKAGDFIIEMAGKPVKNIEDYMTVLGAQKADVEIEIVVKRKDERKTLKVTPKSGR
jgi:Peptidase family M28/PDZ domain/PA domain